MTCLNKGMDLPIDQLAIVFAKLRTLEEIRKYLQLTEEQLQHPKCGEYIIQRFKNWQQPMHVMREKNSIKDFPVDPPFPGELSKGE